ncbi:helix-turn-helix domain-containing protein [Natronomonas halophila]|uniref:winged helix-turn-helix transcriptional regulator n=1 Tax=Natronomonas halophila TaxID=2747817 RepID=UPI0015B78AD4|nr:helix-turn-helix domain-containing protein [Natronomonas halophila]QLD87241.1 helix-turn-helix domain-containing protein [Natronomonas halophila]
MDRRPLVAILVALLVVGLFAPPAVATTSAPEEGNSLTVPTGFELPEIDRYRSVVVSSGLLRADTEGILNQRTRAAVYEAIRESPGATLSALADAVGVTKSTVRYHVDVLRDAGLVEAVEVGGALRVAPAEMDADIAAATSAEPTNAVLEAVAETEPASVRAVAEVTGRAPSTVSYHLSTLADRGLVERERAGEAVLTRLTPETRDALSSPVVAADD